MTKSKGIKNPKVNVTCERCGVDFKVFVKRQFTARFCSMKCAYPPSMNVCKTCGVSFRRPPSDVANFCSRKCSVVQMSSIAKTHGESKSRLHKIWCNMKTRCTYVKSQAYVYYGGRGIQVCNEWLNSYEAFRDWAIENGYEPQLELDRINVNGNYQPDNCRWATRPQQMTNTRKRKNAKTSKYKGVSRHSQNSSWTAQIHHSHKTYNLGSYRTQLAAALAYDKAADDAFGEFAHVNFPERIRFLRERTVSHFSFESQQE